MKKHLASLSLVAAALTATGIALASPALAAHQARSGEAPRPAASQARADDFWAYARFEQDYDDDRRYGALPRPSRQALSRIGVVMVLDVEWDDGRIEVEGVDARGREVDVVMDRTGQRVLRHRVERWDD